MEEPLETETEQQQQENERFVLDDDDDSSDEELVVTIGDIKKNVPFQKGPAGKIDLDEEPELDGQMIYDLDLAAMDEKPWQKPGADITDYFNYGFTEETWNLYCERQKKLRLEYGNQKDVNKAIMSSINLNSSMPVNVTNLLNASNQQPGRQLVNLAGPDKPQKANKMIYDLSKVMTEQPIQTISTTTHIQNDFDSVPTSPTEIYNKPHDTFSSSSTAPPGVEGPPGVDGPPGDDNQPVPSFDASVPPPNFNPNVPPPNMGANNMMNMPPPMFNQVPIHVSAGFGGQQSNFNSRPQPLMNRGGYNGSGAPYEEERRERSTRYSRREREGEDEEDSRRRRRKYSRSPSPKRRRDDRERERDRDKDRKESTRSSKRREERKRSRERDDEHDREKERKRTRRERSPRESRSSRRREELRPIKQEMSPDAPPGVED